MTTDKTQIEAQAITFNQPAMLSFLALIARTLNLNLVLRWLHKIPKYKRGVWWNQSCHMREEKYPKVFDKEKRYIDCVVGQEVKMGETKLGEDILYKVIKVWRTQGSDWLYDTDAYTCNLKFSRIAKPKN